VLLRRSAYSLRPLGTVGIRAAWTEREQASWDYTNFALPACPTKRSVGGCGG